jgi:hypothetical protein
VDTVFLADETVTDLIRSMTEQDEADLLIEMLTRLYNTVRVEHRILIAGIRQVQESRKDKAAREFHTKAQGEGWQSLAALAALLSWADLLAAAGDPEG